MKWKESEYQENSPKYNTFLKKLEKNYIILLRFDVSLVRMYLGKISVVVSFHLVIEHFAFLRVRVGNQLVLKKEEKIGER